MNRTKSVGLARLVAALTIPSLALQAANPIPLTLPRPDGKPGQATKPVKGYLLAGQSNMNGMGDLTGARPPWPSVLLASDLAIIPGSMPIGGSALAAHGACQSADPKAEKGALECGKVALETGKRYPITITYFKGGHVWADFRGEFKGGKVTLAVCNFPMDNRPPEALIPPGDTLSVWLEEQKHEIMHEDVPARRPTGTFLAPGSLATVTVPPSLVGKGYAVRVGAHSWDNARKPRAFSVGNRSRTSGVRGARISRPANLGQNTARYDKRDINGWCVYVSPQLVDQPGLCAILVTLLSYKLHMNSLVNDHYPFIRCELKDQDSAGYALIAGLWEGNPRR